MTPHFTTSRAIAVMCWGMFRSLLVAAATCAALAGEPATPVFEPAARHLRDAIEQGRASGALHLVVRDGTVIHLVSAGVSDPDTGAPFQPDTLVRIYSMTKPITSVAAMTLFEQGRFVLDDPVARFIPAFSNVTVLQQSDGTIQRVAPKRPITVRDVLRHTTGYSYGDDPPEREFYEREGMRYWGPDELYPPRLTIARAAEALARIPAVHQPGEKFTYGFSTDLLGRLVEVWSGQPLDAYLRQAIFAPLEMIDTGFAVPPARRGRLAPCLGFRDGKRVVVDPAATSPFNDGFEFLSGGGGLVSTARDYANFCQMLVNGGMFKGRRVLKEETLRLMFTDQLKGVAGGTRFGFGFGIKDTRLGTGATSRSAIELSWGGYASTDFRIVRSEKLVQIVIRQEVPPSNELAAQLFDLLYAGWPLAKPAPPTGK